MDIHHRLKHPQSGKSGLSYNFFGKTDSRPLHIVESLNMVFVGSPWEDDNGTIEGKVYVYDMRGTIITTLSTGDESFGITVHAVEHTKKLYVGAHLSDKVYVYDIDNEFLLERTIQADTSGEHFGWAISGVSSYYCADEYDGYTGQTTTSEMRVNRLWIGAPQGNVVYEYTDDGATLIHKMGPNESVGSWPWLYPAQDIYGINITNFKTEIAEFGYSIHSAILVKDVRNQYGNYVHLIIGAPGSHNDFGATIATYSDTENVIDALAYDWYFDTEYPNPLNFYDENGERAYMDVPFRTGEKVHFKGLDLDTGVGASSEHMATLNSGNPYRVQVDGLMLGSSEERNYTWAINEDGEKFHSLTSHLYDGLFRSCAGQPSEHAIFYTSWDDRGVKKLVWDWDSNDKLILKSATSYYSQAFIPKACGYDPVNRLVIWGGSIYLYIHYDRVDSPTSHSLDARKTNWNVRVSGGGITRNVVCHNSSMTAFLTWDRFGQRPDVISYTNPYSPTLVTKLGTTTTGPAYGYPLVDNVNDKLYIFGYHNDSLNDGGGLFVYDLATTPTNPPLIASITQTSSPEAMFPLHWSHDDDFLGITLDTDRNVLYCAAYAWDNVLDVKYTYIWVFDVSNPAAPTKIGGVQVPGGTNQIRGLVHYGTRVYVMIWEAIYTYDVTTPASPVLINTETNWTGLEATYLDRDMSTLTMIETTRPYYENLVYESTDPPTVIVPTNPQYPAFSEIYSEDDYNQVRMLSSPVVGENDSGIIEYYYHDTATSGTIIDPDGQETSQELGRSMAVSESYVVANSKQGDKDVLLMQHPGHIMFRTYYECEPTCALIRMYDANNDQIPLSHEFVSAPDGTSEFHDENFDRNDWLIVVHHRGQIQVYGKHAEYVEDIGYGPPPPPKQYKVTVNVFVDGFKEPRQVSLFDKLTGAFEASIVTDPNAAENIIETDNRNLKFIIAFDPSGRQDPIAIDDIYPDLI